MTDDKFIDEECLAIEAALTEDKFVEHAALILRQDKCTVGEARFRAWSEGPAGYATRLCGNNVPDWRAAMQWGVFHALEGA